MMEPYRAAKLSTRDYVRIAFFGAMMIAVGLVFGLVLGEALGPGMAVANGFLMPLILAIAVLTVNKFPVGTILLTIYGIAIIGMPVWGPPGPHKILQGFVSGFVFDGLYLLMSRRTARLGITLSSGVMTSLGVVFMYIAIRLLGFRADRFIHLFRILVVVGFGMGCAAGLLATRIVRRGRTK